MAKSDASQTTLNGQFGSGKAKTGSKETYLYNFNRIIILDMPRPLHILLREVEQWPSHIRVIHAVLMQVIDKTKPVTQVLF